MALLIGIVLALSIGLMATLTGLDRDRAWYPAVTLVVGSYYALFAVMGASGEIIVIESLVGMVFLAAAVGGFRTSLWVVAAALAAHGVFDFFHGDLIVNPGMPLWWPSFCLAYDVTAAVYLAWLLKRGRVRAGNT